MCCCCCFVIFCLLCSNHLCMAVCFFSLSFSLSIKIDEYTMCLSLKGCVRICLSGYRSPISTYFLPQSHICVPFLFLSSGARCALTCLKHITHVSACDLCASALLMGTGNVVAHTMQIQYRRQTHTHTLIHTIQIHDYYFLRCHNYLHFSNWYQHEKIKKIRMPVAIYSV